MQRLTTVLANTHMYMYMYMHVTATMSWPLSHMTAISQVLD